MKISRKWLFVLIALVLFGVLFAEPMITLYIDLVWFEKYGIASVIWTILTAQLGCALVFGGTFFVVTYGILRRVYTKTSHLPVMLSDQTRRGIPFLELIAENLKPLVNLVPLVFSIFIALIAADRWEVTLKFLNQVRFNETDPIFSRDISFYLFTLPFLEMLISWIWAGLALTGFGIAIIYFFKQYIFVSPDGFTTLPEARRTLSVFGAFVFLHLAFDLYLRRFGLLIDGNSSVVAGVSYADDWGSLPAFNLLVALGGPVAAGFGSR